MTQDPHTNPQPERRRRPPRSRSLPQRPAAADTPEGVLAVGRIVGVHGIRGEVKVELYTDFPERFTAGAEFLLGAGLEPVEVVKARPHKGSMLVALQGVSGRSEAEALRGEWLYIDEGDAAELEEGAYWVHDILGLRVRDSSGKPLGVVTDVLVTGANDVYVVADTENVRQGRELLLPALESVVQEVDLEAGWMTVVVPEGLLDESE